MSRIRGWQLVGGLIAVAAIGVAIAVYVAGNRRLDVPGSFAYLPNNRAAILYFDFSALRNSGLLDKIVGTAVGEEAEYRSFVERTGFNYKRDLDKVSMSSAAGSHYMLLQGRFDWDKLKAYASQEGGRCDGEYCSVKGSTPGRIISFHRPANGVLALASGPDEGAARQIQKRPAEALPFTVPSEPLWMHVPREILQAQRQAPSGTKLFLKALEVADSALFTLGPKENDFQLSLDVRCNTEEQAAVLRAQLESVTSLLQSFIRRENQKPSASDLSGVLTSGVFQRDLARVTGRWMISKAFVDSLAAK